VSYPLHITGIPKYVVTNISCSQAVARIDERLKHIEKAILTELTPWAPDYKPIRFVDALDGRVLLPYELFRNYKVITPSIALVPVNN
jgi:hypothetical protein